MGDVHQARAEGELIVLTGRIQPGEQQEKTGPPAMSPLHRAPGVSTSSWEQAEKRQRANTSKRSGSDVDTPFAGGEAGRVRGAN